jgi:hypothetical protein
MPWPSCFKFDGVERDLFAAGPPTFSPIAIRQSELRLHVGERGQELLLALQGVHVAEEFRFCSAMKRRLDERLALAAPLNGATSPSKSGSAQAKMTGSRRILPVARTAGIILEFPERTHRDATSAHA